MRSLTAFDAVLEAAAIRPPLLARIARLTTTLTGATVAEGAPKPAQTMSFAEVSLTPKKCAALACVTKEFLIDNDASADALGRELQSATAAATDALFLTDIGPTD